MYIYKLSPKQIHGPSKMIKHDGDLFQVLCHHRGAIFSGVQGVCFIDLEVLVIFGHTKSRGLHSPKHPKRITWMGVSENVVYP